MTAPTSDTKRSPFEAATQNVTARVNGAGQIHGSLLPHHVEYLRQRAVDPAHAVAGGVISVGRVQGGQLLRRGGPLKCNGLAIIYPGSGYARVRLDDPSDGARYLSPAGAEIPIYFAPGREPPMERGPLVIVESAVKALSVAAAGFDSVGLAGVATTLTKGKPVRLNQSWATCPVEGRDVVLLFDSNRATNASVAQAEACLAVAIEAAGAATVRVAVIPISAGHDVGPDDFHADKGADALAALIQSAVGADPVTRASQTDDPLALLGDLPFRFAVLRRPIEAQERTRIVLRKKGLRMQALDSALDEAKRMLAGSEVAAAPPARNAITVVEDVEPWPERVDGAALLEELANALHRYIALPSGAYTAIALWIVHSHAFDASDYTPRLAIISPTKRCGKTRLLTLLAAMARRAFRMDNATPAVVFRLIEARRPTLFIDEADTFLEQNNELRGVLNSGHHRKGAVARCVGDEHEPRAFSTWAPVAVAAIGRLPDTLMDRAIAIRMARKRPDQSVARYRSKRDEPPLRDIARRCARWAADEHDRLCAATPELPDELDDRAQDNWEPLLTIADAAGGEWPEKARRAALVLSTGRLSTEDDRATLGQVLLEDIRELFARVETDRLSSRRLVELLVELEERPWGETNYGKPITPRGVAALLRPFGIRSKTIRVRAETPKGYELAAFADAFSRYLAREHATAATHAKSPPIPRIPGATASTFGSAPAPHPSPSDFAPVALVAGQPPPAPRRPAHAPRAWPMPPHNHGETK